MFNGYTSPDHWIGVSPEESSMSLTDESRNQMARAAKLRGVNLIWNHFRVTPEDAFAQIVTDRFGIRLDEIRTPDAAEASRFAVGETLPERVERYHFKPWGCLTSVESHEYLAGGRLGGGTVFCRRLCRTFSSTSDRQRSLFSSSALLGRRII